MNRHERRRAAKVRIEKIETDKFLSMPSMCAWEGCNAHVVSPHEHGWASLIMHCDEPKANFMDIDHRLMYRDCALCPEHTQKLDGLLKYIGRDIRVNATCNA